jgi:hypothetical protein
MKKCLIYGNCQAGIIHKAFLQTDLVNFYDTTYIICHHNKFNNIDFIDISQFDLIITMPIYEHIFYKSTSNMLSKKRNDCIVIIFPSLYFDFYFPNLTYLKIKKDESGDVDQLLSPNVFHDQNLLNIYKNYGNNEKILIEKYKDIVFSPDFYSKDHYTEKYNKSIDNLKKRLLRSFDLYKAFEPIHFIDVIDFIENNYRKDLLFYSNPHPKYEYVIKIICEEILSIIKKEDIKIPQNLPPSASDGNQGYSFKLPLYYSISSLVDFDVKKYMLPILKNTVTAIEDYVKIHIDVYRQECNQKYFSCDNYF